MRSLDCVEVLGIDKDGLNQLSSRPASASGLPAQWDAAWLASQIVATLPSIVGIDDLHRAGKVRTANILDPESRHP